MTPAEVGLLVTNCCLGAAVAFLGIIAGLLRDIRSELRRQRRETP